MLPRRSGKWSQGRLAQSGFQGQGGPDEAVKGENGGPTGGQVPGPPQPDSGLEESPDRGGCRRVQQRGRSPVTAALIARLYQEIGQLEGGAGFLVGEVRSMPGPAAADGGSGTPIVAIARQCALLGVARSSLYYRPREASGENPALMQAMDPSTWIGLLRVEAHTGWRGRAYRKPEAGAEPADESHGVEGHLPSPRTSRPAPEHRVYPYLLEKIRVTAAQPGSADITYLPMARGFPPREITWRPVCGGPVQHLGGRLLRDALKEALVASRRSSTPNRRPSRREGAPSWRTL